MTSEKNGHYQRIFRFIISGGLAAGTEYAVFLGLSLLLGRATASLVAAQVMSFTAGLFVSFYLNKHWSFQSKGPMKQEFIRYVMLAIINLCLSTIVLWALVTLCAASPWVAKIVVMAMIASWNFVLFDRVVFASRSKIAE